MTLPPTSKAPVDSRMIGGFARSPCAKAVLLTKTNNIAAANGVSCCQFFELPPFMICLLNKLYFAFGRSFQDALAQSAEQAVREEQQHDEQDGERHDDLVASADHDDGAGLHHAAQHAADERGRRTAAAADARSAEAGEPDRPRH